MKGLSNAVNAWIFGYYQFMFPTRGKSKIPPSLAYPVNAKIVSEALANVPQSQNLSLCFFYYSTRAAHKIVASYPVISASYTYHKASQFTPHHFEEAGMNEPKWEVMVHPVPIAIKHHIAELLKREAFPKMQVWLFQKENLTGQQQTEGFRVFYNETTDELEYKEYYHP